MNRRMILQVWLPQIIGLCGVAYIFYTAPGTHGLARWLGLLLSLIGLAGVIVARYTLGQSFSIAPKARALVTRGVYSRVRNPIYVSGEILIAGVALMLWRIAPLIVLLALIPLQLLRARREAAVLEAKFGDAYREYRKRTWF
jgi:protein-S-isoprenylcysteine O-methyltransferase Ste14